MNESAKLVADNLDREDGLPTKAIVHLPPGRLTAAGFRQALRHQTHTEVITTVLEDGTVAVARKYIKEIIKLLNQVYPSVELELTFDGKFHQCHVNCHEAKGSICECKCLYLFHGGDGLPGVVVNWKTHPTKGYMIGREEDRVVEHIYTNEGLPLGGNDMYYMARLFEGVHEWRYLQWYENEVARNEEAKAARLYSEVKSELDAWLRRGAAQTGLKYNVFRFRVAQAIEREGFGTLRKATFGMKGNAEELIIDYIIEAHNGDIEAAFGKEGKESA